MFKRPIHSLVSLGVILGIFSISWTMATENDVVDLEAIIGSQCDGCSCTWNAFCPMDFDSCYCTTNVGAEPPSCSGYEWYADGEWNSWVCDPTFDEAAGMRPLKRSRSCSWEWECVTASIGSNLVCTIGSPYACQAGFQFCRDCTGKEGFPDIYSLPDDDCVDCL